jgi:hypothetical protein
MILQINETLQRIEIDQHLYGNLMYAYKSMEEITNYSVNGNKKNSTQEKGLT